MPRVVYLTWPATEISGGIKVAFQHVEMLVDAGVDAIVASRDGAGPEWFETRAAIATLDEVKSDDVLVFPENSAALFQHFANSPQPKLVFCQNTFLSHLGLAGRKSYAEWGVRHLMGCSHTVVQYCRDRFPELPASYTPFFVDHSRFGFQPRKTLQVATSPRKRPIEFGAIADLFRARFPQYAALNWVYLNQATEAQVAAVMGQSAVFLSLARLEAHGMTTLEAMACGCLVAGFTGLVGGTDSATARNGFWAAEDDIHGCVEQLGRAVKLADSGDPLHHAMVEAGRRTAAEYTRGKTSEIVVEFWRKVLGDRP